MARHICLGTRKAFALRLAYLEAVAANGARDSLESDPRWKAIQAFIETHAKKQVPPSRSTERLDHMRKRISQEWILQWPRASARAPDAFDMTLATLNDRLQALDCNSCVNGSNLMPCYGDVLHDHEVVASHGACIARIKNTYSRVLALAVDHYTNANVARSCRVELETCPDIPEPAGSVLLAFGGEVNYIDDDKGAAATVRVAVDVLSFDEKSLDQLPYVIAHEAYCHVFQYIQGGPRPNRRQPFDILAEGWIDYVAAMIIAGGPNARSLDYHGPFNPDEADAARQIHDARRDRKAGNHYRHAGNVQVGHEAAELVRRLFLFDNKDRAWEDFVDLSLQLNAHPWAWEQRSKALCALCERIKTDDDLQYTLIKWRSDRDVQPVVAELVKKN